MKFITKGRLLTASLVIGVGVYLFARLLGTDWCEGNLFCFNYLYWGNYTDSVVLAISGFVFATLPMTLIAYPFPDRAFEAWKLFAVLATPVVIVLTYVIDSMPSGMLFHPGLIYLPFLYGAFFLISLIIIAVSAIRRRKTSRQ